MDTANQYTAPLTTPLVLHQKIRHATEPDNPTLISQFLNLPLCTNTNSKKAYREQLASQFELLIETIADECLPAHWRCQCLDQIYRPLLALQRVADCPQSKQQVRKLTQELRVISHYLQPGLLA